MLPPRSAIRSSSKATFGGGGRGMRIVREPDQLKVALQAAAREIQRRIRPGGSLSRAPTLTALVTSRSRCWPMRSVTLYTSRATAIVTVQRASSEADRGGSGACVVGKRFVPALLTAQFALQSRSDYRSAGTAEFLFDPQSQQFLFHGDEYPPCRWSMAFSEARVGNRPGAQPDSHRLWRNRLPFHPTGPSRIRGSAIQAARGGRGPPGPDFRPAAGPVRRFALAHGPVGSDVISGIGQWRCHQPATMTRCLARCRPGRPTREGARKRLIHALELPRGPQGVETTAPYLATVLGHSDFATVAHHTGSIERVVAARRLQTRSRCVRPTNLPAAAVTPVRRVRLSTSQGALEVDVTRANIASRRRFAQRRTQPSTAALPVFTSRVRRTRGLPSDGVVIQVAVKIG